jgi:hypothetical protein
MRYLLKLLEELNAGTLEVSERGFRASGIVGIAGIVVLAKLLVFQRA